jgi:ribosomal protein L6P/L9E
MKGPKGTLSMPMADEVTYTLEDGKLTVKPANATSAPARSGVCSARWCRTSLRA